MSGKVVVVTGANAGIGLEAALQFALRGSTVHMLCRSEARGLAARDDIVRKTGNEKVHLHVTDVSRLDDVKAFSKKFQSTSSVIDVLVNNAGVLLAHREQTPSGIDTSFATNVLGPHLLTSFLVPCLKKSQDARIINVSSGGMYTSKLDPTDLQSRKIEPFNGATVYAHEKRQMVIMTTEMAKRNPDILFFSMHPGWVETPGVEKSIPDFYHSMKNRLRTVQQGVDTIIWLSVANLSDTLKSGNGQFWFDREVVRQHLSLFGTDSSEADIKSFMDQLDKYCE